MTQPVIVVVTASPAEAAFYYGGFAIPLMGGLAVGFVVFLLLMKVFDRHINGPGSRWANWILGCSAVISLIAGALTFHWLFL